MSIGLAQRRILKHLFDNKLDPTVEYVVGPDGGLLPKEPQEVVPVVTQVEEQQPQSQLPVVEEQEEIQEAEPDVYQLGLKKLQQAEDVEPIVENQPAEVLPPPAKQKKIKKKKEDKDP